MYSLTLEITKRCNLNCSYCYVENKEKVNMKWKTAQLAIDIAMREAIKQKDKGYTNKRFAGNLFHAVELSHPCSAYSSFLCSRRSRRDGRSFV